jgi:phosphoadenosine phosphosulfate reductase
LNKFLKDTNQYDSTLFVLTGDHGENLSNHDIPFNHENLYDDVVKVPLIISHPQIKNKASTKLVQHVDIVPTLLQLLKIKTKHHFDGIDILSKESRKFAYFEDISYRKLDFPAQTRRRGLILGKKKYIQTFTGNKQELRKIIPKESLILKKEQLFDLNSDRLENNLHFSHIDNKSKYRIALFNIITNLALQRFKKDPLYNKYLKTINILKKVNKQYSYNDLAIAWKGGKDTTTLMHIIRTFHKGIIPYKVFFNDTTLEFKEVYSFIDQVKQLWNLRLTKVKHSEEELKKYYSEKNQIKRKELARLMKITAIKSGLKKLNIKGYMLGIRRDENPARQNEKHFSSRKDHIRIHPLLDFTEQDIWKYIKFFGVPYLNLYDKGYRSIGEKPFTKKVPKGGYERTGRDQEKEKTMTRLRQLGYW